MQKEPTTQITIYTYNIQYKLHLKKYKIIAKEKELMKNSGFSFLTLVQRRHVPLKDQTGGSRLTRFLSLYFQLD